MGKPSIYVFVESYVEIIAYAIINELKGEIHCYIEAGHSGGKH